MAILQGAYVNSDDKDGNLPIHYAARHNCGEAAEALCKAGADANAKNRDGEVPLVGSFVVFVVSE